MTPSQPEAPARPDGIEIETPDGPRRLPPGDDGAPLTRRLADAGFPLNTRCGERGLCAGCVVELVRGRVRDAAGAAVEAAEPPPRIRACRHTAPADPGAAVRIPPRSLLAARPQVLAKFKLNVPLAHDPLWQRLALEKRADLEPAAFLDAVARRRADGRALLPDEPWPAAADAVSSEAVLRFRESGWSARPATGADPGRPLGAAIDVGTTTVAVMIVDLEQRRVLGRSSELNAQIRFGDNVLTRIQRCLSDPTNVATLQRALIDETLAPLLGEALADAEAPARDLVALVAAGNTTMLHLLAGADPAPMGSVPFEPAFLEHRTIPASRIGLGARDARLAAGDGAAATPADALSDAATLHLLPGAAAYVGADLTAGMLSSGLVYDRGPSLLVDVGTNGEILARYGERLVGCATAAGPAFEGAGLAWGMRAADGAIAHVAAAGDPPALAVETIGSGPAAGVCGSAYIDLLAEGRRTGLLTEAGRIDVACAEAANLLADAGTAGRALRLAETAEGEPILATEADLAALLQAKAAIAAGIVTLLERLGIGAAEVARLYLAGGFGMNARVEQAIGCGLLPGFRPDQVQLVGNTALAGAYLTLLDAGALEEIASAARGLELIELNQDPGFEMAFIEQLVLETSA